MPAARVRLAVKNPRSPWTYPRGVRPSTLAVVLRALARQPDVAVCIVAFDALDIHGTAVYPDQLTIPAASLIGFPALQVRHPAGSLCLPWPLEPPL